MTTNQQICSLKETMARLMNKMGKQLNKGK